MALHPLLQAFVTQEDLALQMTFASVTKGGEDITVKGSVQTATSTTSSSFVSFTVIGWYLAKRVVTDL